MGSSKKSKDKDREKEHKRKKRHRSRSRSPHEHTERKQKKREDDPYADRDGQDSPPPPPPPRIPPPPPPKREPIDDSDVKPSGGGKGGDISLSIQETNRLRAKLGLKPLEEPKVKTEAEAALLGSTDGVDVHKPATNINQIKQQETLQKKLLEIKEKRKINQKLGKVRKLADSDSDDEGALAWIKKSRKMQKEKDLAEKRAKALAEMDEEFGVESLVEQEFSDKRKTYDSKDLKGIQVLHDQDRFKEGMTTILTLQDKGVLDEEADDVLVNYNLMDDEKAEEYVTNKKKLPDYNPYDDGAVDEYGMFKEKNLLSKYDEEIEGKKANSFQLGAGGKYDTFHERQKLMYQESIRQKAETLTIPTPKLASEFYSENEMESFNKVKKKVRKIRKKPKMMKADDILPLDDKPTQDFGKREVTKETEEGELMEMEAIPGLDLVEPPAQEEEEEDMMGPELDLTGVPVEDDGDYESRRILSKAKRLKERNDIPVPEDTFSEIGPVVEEPEETRIIFSSLPGSVTLNATSEFCRVLGDIPTYGHAGNRPEEEEEELMDYERELAEERLRNEAEQAEQAAKDGWQEVEIDDKPAAIADEDHGVLDEEAIIGPGIGSALRVAQIKGFIEDENLTKGASSSRITEIDTVNYSIEDKRYDDLDDKFRKRGDRYVGGVTQEFKEINYKPEVNIEYVDELGRPLNAKEAFRQLSHRFHGKGSGKKKLEKRSKKWDQAQLMKNASSTDTPLGTVNLFREKQRAEKSAYLVLSGANKSTLTGGSVSK